LTNSQKFEKGSECHPESFAAIKNKLLEGSDIERDASSPSLLGMIRTGFPETIKI